MKNNLISAESSTGTANLRPRRRNSREFTLIELLVVIAIIAILASILLPALSSARRRSHAIKCTSTLKSLGTMCQLYAQDYNSRFPPRYVDDYRKWTYYIAAYYGINDLANADRIQKLIKQVFCPERFNFTGMSYSMNSMICNAPGALLLPKISVPGKAAIIADGYRSSMNDKECSNSFDNTMLPGKAGVLWDNVHPGTNVNILFVDGHVEARTRLRLTSWLGAVENARFWYGRNDGVASATH